MSYGGVEKLRVLLVLPRAKAARSLSQILGDRCEVVGVCSRAGEAIERLWRTANVEAIVVNEQLLGEMSGLQLLEFLAAYFPSVRRVLLADRDRSVTRTIVHASLQWEAVPTDLLAVLERGAAS